MVIKGSAVSSSGEVTYYWEPVNSDFNLSDSSRVLTPLNRPLLVRLIIIINVIIVV